MAISTFWFGAALAQSAVVTLYLQSAWPRPPPWPSATAPRSPRRGTPEPSARGTGLALGLCTVLVLLSLAISLRRVSDTPL
jgi:hypothetical protein